MISRGDPLDTVYANDWARFVSWCDARACTPVQATPESVALFLKDEFSLGYSSSTLSHRLAAIGHMHRRCRAVPPLTQGGGVIREALCEIAATRISPHLLQATTTVLRTVLQSIDEETLHADRDRALIALRIAGAFQLSEIATLSFSRIARQQQELMVFLGRGRASANPRSFLTIVDDSLVQPVTMLDRWLERAEITNGLIFRQIQKGAPGQPLSKQDVAEIIERRALAAGYQGEALSRITTRKSSINAQAA